MPSNKSQERFNTLKDFFGWHGTFVLVTIVIFKILLTAFDASPCPCTGNVVYGTAMLGLPAVCIFIVAFFTYFFQEDTQSPWKDLKAYYKMKQPCSYSATGRNWEMHSGVFHQCTECQGKWQKIKITVSFLVSLVYPILWLAMGFLQVTFYTCAHVGPNPEGVYSSCDNWKNPPPDDYPKKYSLAVNKSLFVGNVLVVVVIVLASVIFITYRVVRSKIPGKDDLEIEDNYGHHERPPQTPTNNFGHGDQAVVVTPGTYAHTPVTRSTEGPSPVSGPPSYEGFRERSGDMGRGRASPRETQPLIKVDA